MQPITITATINASIEKVWECWTSPDHIIHWNFASGDWHTPYAENDLRPGGKFKSTMASRDGAMSFDFEGNYTDVKKHELIAYTIADGRKVSTHFRIQGKVVIVTSQFEPETTNPPEMQQHGWQAILDNFKKYAER